jgi:hypothetical protein
MLDEPQHHDGVSPCEACGARWEPAEEIGHGALEMVHQTDCAWLAAVDKEAAEREV